MVFAPALLLFATHAPLTRAQFAEAMRQLPLGATPAEVRRKLGKPDHVHPSGEELRRIDDGSEEWQYGCDRSDGFATLGTAYFEDGKLTGCRGADGRPPLDSVVSEAELVRHLRALERSQEGTEADPLALIQEANRLIPLGKEKALAVISEYSRLLVKNEERLGILGRTIFASAHPETSAFPGVWGMSPLPVGDPSEWPTYPVFLAEDVPYQPATDFFYGGYAPPIYKQIPALQKAWSLRDRPFRPPDDPFPAFESLMNSPRWERTIHRAQDPSRVRMEMTRQLLRLVRTVSHVPDFLLSISRPRLDEFHANFLKAGGHWSIEQQRYVRRDGSYTPDPVARPFDEYRYRFRGIPDVDVKIVFHRDGHALYWEATPTVNVPDDKPFPAIVLIVERVRDNWPLAMRAVNRIGGTDAAKVRKFLAEPPRASDGTSMLLADEFPLKRGEAIRVVLQIGKQRFESPVYRP